MQLVMSSDILHFTTDAPQNSSPMSGRVAVPISDAEAHATFYLVAFKDAPERVREIVG